MSSHVAKAAALIVSESVCECMSDMSMVILPDPWWNISSGRRDAYALDIQPNDNTTERLDIV
jgi:hypothetical protein